MEALKDCYQKGYEDGFNGTDVYDAQMSYGSQEEIEYYQAGVEFGRAVREIKPCTLDNLKSLRPKDVSR